MKTIVYFIAFREDDRDMIPVSNDGVISLFHTLSEAKSAGGQLGGGIATEFDGLKAICERFGLTF